MQSYAAINFSATSNRTECFRLLQQKLGHPNKHVQTMRDYFAPNPFWNLHIQDISCMLSRFKPRMQTLCLLDVFCSFEITQFERITGWNRKLKINLGLYRWFFLEKSPFNGNYLVNQSFNISKTGRFINSKFFFRSVTFFDLFWGQRCEGVTWQNKSALQND